MAQEKEKEKEKEKESEPSIYYETPSPTPSRRPINPSRPPSLRRSASTGRFRNPPNASTPKDKRRSRSLSRRVFMGNDVPDDDETSSSDRSKDQFQPPVFKPKMKQMFRISNEEELAMDKNVENLGTFSIDGRSNDSDQEKIVNSKKRKISSSTE